MLIANWRRTIVGLIVTVGVIFSVAISAQAQGEPLSLNTEAVLLDAAWSPDGQLLAIAGDWGIRFFTSDLHELAALALPDDAINAITWRPDGLQIAGGLNDGTVQIWDKAPSSNTFTLNIVLSTDHQWVSDVSWSPNSDFLAFWRMICLRVVWSHWGTALSGTHHGGL